MFHAGNLTSARVGRVPFAFTLSTGGLGIRGTHVVRSPVDAQVGFRWDIRMTHAEEDAAILAEATSRAKQGELSPRLYVPRKRGPIWVACTVSVR